MSELVVFRPEDVPQAVAEAIRNIQRKHPEYQSHIRKRLWQRFGHSHSFWEKVVYGQHTRLDSAHLLNANAFFSGLLIPEIQGEQISETERQELIEMARQIQRIAGKWTLGK